MDAQGLVARTRDNANRRVQVVTLTEAGEAAFLRLRTAAIAFDARLRAGFAEADLASLDAKLHRLAANTGTDDAAPPWPPPRPRTRSTRRELRTAPSRTAPSRTIRRPPAAPTAS
jgi:hypothetical protein